MDAQRLTETAQPVTPRARGGSAWYVALGAAIGLLLLSLAVRRVDWAAVAGAVAGASPGWLALSALGMTATHVMLAIRWRALADVDGRMSLADAFDFVMIGTLTSLVLPPRVGDVARAVATGRYHQLSPSRLFGTILVERLLDVIMLLCFGVALSALMVVPSVVQAALVMVFVAALAATTVAWMGASGPLGAITRWLARWRGAESRSLPMFAGFVDGISVVRERARVPRALFATLMAWICTAAAIRCGIQAFGVSVPWYAGAFVGVVVNLGGIIPAPPAGIGVYHYLAKTSVSLWVASPSTAFAFALVNHAVSFAVALVLGSASLARKGLSLRGLRGMATESVADGEVRGNPAD